MKRRWVIFPGKLKKYYFQVGKNVAKTCSVFLHATMRYAADEWWMNEGVGALLRSGDVGSPKRGYAAEIQTAENCKDCPTGKLRACRVGLCGCRVRRQWW